MTREHKKWRHLYRYICRGCTKIRYTKSWQRHQQEMCTLCEKANVVPKDQTSLFNIEPSV